MTGIFDKLDTKIGLDTKQHRRFSGYIIAFLQQYSVFLEILSVIHRSDFYPRFVGKSSNPLEFLSDFVPASPRCLSLSVGDVAPCPRAA